MNSISVFSGKIYPDGSLSVGQKPREKKLKAEKDYDKAFYNQIDSYTEYERHYAGRKVTTVSWLDGRVRDTAKFNSSGELSQTNSRYGLSGITGYGKKIVRSGAALLQKTFGKDRVAFVTLTMPNFSLENAIIIAKYWGECVRLYFQKLRRLLKSRGAPLELVCVTEIQPNRYKKYGVVAPHLHYMYVCKQEASDWNWIVSCDEKRQMWNDVLMTVLIKKGGNYYEKWNRKACCNAKRIKYSAVGYIGKYMSKGGEIIAKIVENGREDELPRQWWTASSEMKAWIKSEVIELEDSICEYLIDNVEEAVEIGLLTWGKPIYITWNDREIKVGIVGKITEEQLFLLRDIFSENKIAV